MRRKRFFMELGNQLLFGLFVTLFCFVIYSCLSVLALTSFDFQMVRYAKNAQDSFPIQMSVMKILIFSALLCSSDTVAAVSIVDYKA